MKGGIRYSMAYVPDIPNQGAGFSSQLGICRFFAILRSQSFRVRCSLMRYNDCDRTGKD